MRISFLFLPHPHFIMEIFSYRNLISRLFKLQNVKNGWIKMVLKCGNGEKEYFPVEKSGKHDLSQVIKINTNSNKTYWLHGFLIWHDKWYIISVVFPTQTHISILIMRKTLGKPQLRDIIQNTWTCQNCQNYQQTRKV